MNRVHSMIFVDSFLLERATTEVLDMNCLSSVDIFAQHYQPIVAVVKRLFYGFGTHFTGRCRFRERLLSKCLERRPGRKIVAVVENWPLVEVRL